MCRLDGRRCFGPVSYTHLNGTFVCEQTGRVQDPLGLRFQPDKKRLGLDLCEVRRMIEPEIAALAAQKATEEEIARMQALCDAIEEKVRRNENYGALDQRRLRGARKG